MGRNSWEHPIPYFAQHQINRMARWGRAWSGIGQKHDLQLLQLQVNPATRAAANDWRAMFAHSVQVSDMEVDFYDGTA